MFTIISKNTLIRSGRPGKPRERRPATHPPSPEPQRPYRPSTFPDGPRATRRQAGSSLHVPSAGPAPSSSMDSAPHVQVPSAVPGPVIRPVIRPMPS